MVGVVVGYCFGGVLRRITTFSGFWYNVSFYQFLNNWGGPGNSVGIATDYGLDGSGSNPGGDEIFRPYRPALGPTQLPVQWVPGLSRGVEAAGAWG